MRFHFRQLHFLMRIGDEVVHQRASGVCKVLKGQRVWCMHRKELVSLDLCFYCPLLLSVNLDVVPRTITCAERDTVTEEDMAVYAWLAILKEAALMRNVSRICREREITRYSFYRCRAHFEQKGKQGIREFVRSKAVKGKST